MLLLIVMVDIKVMLIAIRITNDNINRIVVMMMIIVY